MAATISDRDHSISATRRSATAFDRRHWFGKLWRRWSWTAERLNWDARYKAWLRHHDMELFDGRSQMYARLCPVGPITYLEFGVYKGDSLMSWLRLNRHEDSRFHGFDSWEGLAGEAGSPFDAGHFATEMPTIGDARCELHKGRFTETLPALRTNKWPNMIINLDADEYGPTLYVLTMLNPHPGTIIMLDETSVAHCEFRALLDWQRAYDRTVMPLAGWRHGRRIEGIAVRVET